MPDVVPVSLQDVVHRGESGLREVSGQVHLFSVLDDRLALDVASGAVHLLDRISWDVLTGISGPDPTCSLARSIHGHERVDEVEREIDALIENGTLFLPLPRYPGPDSHLPLKALCMNVSHDCNLRCGYCFALTGTFGANRSLMSTPVGRASVDYLIARSGARETVEMDFFGGEPLMNMPTVRATVAYAREREESSGKDFKFTLTTNATLLTGETAAFLNRERMQVVLSLDGRKDTNDVWRCYPDGRGSHDLVVDNMLRFLQTRDFSDYYVRGTYTRRNLDFSRDARHLLDLGINAFSLEPVVANPSLDYAIRDDDLPAVFSEYDRLTSLYLKRWEEGRPFTFYHFELDLTGGPCLRKRMSGCGAGGEYLAVAPDGSLYPCHQFDGMPGFKMGTVYAKAAPGGGGAGDGKGHVSSLFAGAALPNKPRCAGCWARFYCGGGCFAAAWARNGNLSDPDPVACEIQKKRLECAIYAQAKKQSPVVG